MEQEKDTFRRKQWIWTIMKISKRTRYKHLPLEEHGLINERGTAHK